MGESALTGTEFARVSVTETGQSGFQYTTAWIGSYSYTQDPKANTTTLTLYGSMYTNSGTNVRATTSTLKVNDVEISVPSAYSYGTTGFSVNSYYSLFGSTTKVVTHNSNGTFPSQSISIFANASAHLSNKSATGTISGLPTIDRNTPTVTASVTYTSATAVTLSATANYSCNKWEYKIGDGSWTTFSTTDSTSASKSITASSTAQITVRATRTYNGLVGTGTVNVDRSAPTFSSGSPSVSAVGVDSLTLSASTGVACNKWEYQLTSSSSWVSFSTTSGTSASKSITGLSPATTYTINVRVTKTSNYVTATKSVSATTLGYATIDSIANANTGSATTLKFTPKASGFYYKVVYKNGSTTLRTDTIGQVNQTTQYSYTVASFAHSTLPSSTSATITATLYTYSSNAYTSSVQIGTSSATFTLTVPSTVKPTAQISLAPNNNGNTWIKNNMNSYYVAGYSKVTVTTTATAGTGSSVSSISIGGFVTGSGASFTSDIITISGSNKQITSTVTDARGRSATAVGTINVSAYSSPTASSLTAVRGTGTGSNWVASDDGTTIKVTATAKVYLSPTNKAKIYITCNGSTVSQTSLANGDTVTKYFENCSPSNTYTVTAYATDNLTTGSTSTVTVATETIPFSWNRDRIGVGGVPQDTKTFEVATGWSLRAYGKKNRMAFMPYSWEASSGSSAGYIRIATITITGAYISAPITFMVQFRGTAYPTLYYVGFTGTAEETEPTVATFTYSGYRDTSAFIYRTTNWTWDVWVQKQTNSEYATVSVFVPRFVQDRINISYASADVKTEVESGATEAVRATYRPFKLPTNQYYTSGLYGIDMSNSDIVGANSIYFKDVSDGYSEGIHFIDSNNTYDTIYASNGVPYFMKTHTLGTNDGTKETILTSGIAKDYVVSKYTEGNWTVRQWDSGVAECWGKFTCAVPANGWSAWGALYEAQPTTQLAPTYPSGLFNAVPEINVSIHNASVGTSGYELYGTHSKTQAPRVIILRPSSYSSAVTFNVYMSAKGTWK